MPSRGQQMVQSYMEARNQRLGIADQIKRLNAKLRDLEELLGDGMIHHGKRTINLGPTHGVLQVSMLTKMKRRKRQEVELALKEVLPDDASVQRVLSIVYAPVQTQKRKIDLLPPQPCFDNVDIGKLPF